MLSFAGGEQISKPKQPIFVKEKHIFKQGLQLLMETLEENIF